MVEVIGQILNLVETYYKGNEKAFKYGENMEISLKDTNNIIADAAGYTWFGWKTKGGDFLVTRDANKNYSLNIHLDNHFK